MVANAISNNTGLKKATQKVKAHKNQITSIKNPHGSVIIDRKKFVEECANFYQTLYSKTVINGTQYEHSEAINLNQEDLPPILESEVRKALSQIKNNKAQS